MDIREIFQRAQARVGRGRDAALGPLGLAIAHLNQVIAEGKLRQIKSPTFDAIEVVLDSIHKHRDAIAMAGEFAIGLVDSTAAIVAADIETDPKKKAKLQKVAQQAEAKLPDLIKAFKEAAIAAKMEQWVPPSDMREESSGTSPKTAQA